MGRGNSIGKGSVVRACEGDSLARRARTRVRLLCDSRVQHGLNQVRREPGWGPGSVCRRVRHVDNSGARLPADSPPLSLFPTLALSLCPLPHRPLSSPLPLSHTSTASPRGSQRASDAVLSSTAIKQVRAGLARQKRNQHIVPYIV